MKRLSCAIVGFALLFPLAGCGSRSAPGDPGEKDASLVGTWSLSDEQIMLRAMANDQVGDHVPDVDVNSAPVEEGEAVNADWRRKVEARIIGQNTATAQFQFLPGGEVSIQFATVRDGAKSIVKASGSWEASGDTITLSKLGDSYKDSFLPLQFRRVGTTLLGAMRSTAEQAALTKDK